MSDDIIIGWHFLDSQYGYRALACKYDNSCDDSGREPECIPCAFRRAIAQKEETRG